MTDEIVNELLSNVETQRIQIDQLKAENQKLQNENQILQGKLYEMTQQLIDAENEKEKAIIRTRKFSEATQQLINPSEKEDVQMAFDDNSKEEEKKPDEQMQENENLKSWDEQYQEEIQGSEMTMTIEYLADKDVYENEEVLVMGEFNQWLPESMTKKDFGRFEFNVKVISGFKYRYQFIVNGEIVIDPNQDHSESKLGRLTNFKIAEDLTSKVQILPHVSQAPSFIHPEMKKKYLEALEQIKKQESLTQSISEEEQQHSDHQHQATGDETLYKRLQRTKFLIQKLTRLRENLNEAEAKGEIENIQLTREQMKNVDEEYQKIYLGLKVDLTGRYVFSIDAVPISFIIREYRQQTNEIILKRLFDQNGILLDDKLTTINLISTNESTFFSKYQLFSRQDEDVLKNQLIHSKDHIFTIKYQTLYIDDDVECMPVEISPPGISMGDYDIRYDKRTDRVEEIRNRTLGLVRFASYRIDQECGYVRGSKTVIYTTKHKDDMLNLIHIHINDVSEQVTVEAVYMNEDQTIKDFEEFTSDITGQILRYKILVRDMKIFTLLYNGGNGQIEEIPFEEIRLNQGDLMIVKPNSEIPFSDQPMLVKLDRMPVCMIASKDKEKLNGLLQDRNKYQMNGFCKERYFERLPGFVDVSLLSVDNCKSLVPEDITMAIPICFCKTPDEMQVSFYQSLTEDKERQQKRMVIDSIETLEKIADAFDADQKEVSKNLDQMQDYVSKLQIQESELEQVSGQIGDDQGQRLKDALSRSLAIKRRLATEIRMMKLRKQ